MGDSEEDDELFMFASKHTFEGDKDYYQSLLNDVEDNDGADNRGKRKRKAVGLAEELIAGVVQKKSKNDAVLLDDSPKEVNQSSSSESSCTTPTSSPPNTSSHGYNTVSSADDYEALRIMDSIDSTLYSLRKHSRDSCGNCSTVDQESFELSTDNTSTSLRVRCRGKIHTFQIGMTESLSTIVSQLSKIYDDSSVLLQLKSATVKPSDTCAGLQLSTVDILDAFILDKAEVEASVSSVNGERGRIDIKIQSSKKSITYSVDQNEPLSRVMDDFAAQLKAKMSKIKFTFDGELINGTSSVEELEIEDNDIIDAAIIDNC